MFVSKISVCVYCASSSQVDVAYKEVAQSFGTWCAQEGYEIVYGGGHVGLMGLVANAALEAGGRVVGIMPQFLVDKEVAHQGLSEFHTTNTLQERQKMMAEKSDIIVALPGGLGTMAELLEILTWKQLGLTNHPVCIFNQNDYWSHLLAMFDHGFENRFLRQRDHELFDVAENLSDLCNLIKNYQ